MSETKVIPGGIAFGPVTECCKAKIPSAETIERERRRTLCEIACSGIPTEALESGALKHVIDLSAWPYEGEHGSRCEEHEDGCFDCEMVAALAAIGRLKP